MKQSRSISKSRRNNTATPSKSQGRKNNGESEFYYCHFRNAIYMGGIKAFQKHGRGIVIHDDGTCAITSYFNDFKNGHNIFYRQNCILSVEYQKNKILEIVIRVRTYLVLLRMGKDQKPEGRSLLLDYNNRQIFYILYRKGVIAQKLIQKDIAIENKIFDLGNLSYLIGDNHAAAVRFEIERDQNIASQKVSSRLQAGFYRKGFLNGLGFNLLIKDPHLSFDSSRVSNEIFVQLVDRGYYNNSVLNGMGQQKFKNGNSYWGNFKAGVFDGLGILKNEVKQNWVYGQFQSGNLCELLEYSHDGDTNRLTKLIYSLHERKNSWINKDMDIQSFQQYFNEINVILDSNPTQEMNNLKSKKLQVLKKIQDNFLCENEKNQNLQMSQNNQQNDPRSSNMKVSFQQMNVNYNESKKQPQNQQYQINVYKSGKKNSRFKTEVTDPATTKESSERERARQSSIRNYLQVPTSNHSSAASVKKDNSKSPLKKGGTHNQEQLSFALDSKRMVGRNRIFKQSSSDEQQLPKFNYGQN